MPKPDPAMWCGECGALKIITEAGGILCPNGHGRVLSNTTITSRQLRTANLNRKRWQWAARFPLASQIDQLPPAFGSYRITGQEGHWKFKIPDGRNTSRLKWMEQPPEGEVVAGYDGKVFYFQKET